jgi:hypothetical protein
MLMPNLQTSMQGQWCTHQAKSRHRKTHHFSAYKTAVNVALLLSADIFQDRHISLDSMVVLTFGGYLYPPELCGLRVGVGLRVLVDDCDGNLERDAVADTLELGEIGATGSDGDEDGDGDWAGWLRVTVIVAVTLHVAETERDNVLEEEGEDVGDTEGVTETDTVDDGDNGQDGDGVELEDELGTEVGLADGGDDCEIDAMRLEIVVIEADSLVEGDSDADSDVEGDTDGVGRRPARSRSVESIGCGGACCRLNSGTRPTA